MAPYTIAIVARSWRKIEKTTTRQASDTRYRNVDTLISLSLSLSLSLFRAR